MKSRKPMSKKASKKSFTHNAMKVHKANNWSNPMRGGFRL